MSLFKFIRARQAEHPISLMCKLLEVSKSGYYAWLGHTPSARQLENETITSVIVAEHEKSRGTYGVRRIHAKLRQLGVRISRKRVYRLMKVAGISGLI